MNYSILRYGSLYNLRSNDKNGVYKILFDVIKNKKLHYLVIQIVVENLFTFWMLPNPPMR